MNANPLILSALSGVGCPVTAAPGKENADSYIIFNDADNRPAYYADDRDQWDKAAVLVHYYSREPVKSMTAAIKRRLRDAGFTLTGSQESFESGTKYIHVVIEAWIDGPPDDTETEDFTWQKSV